MAYVNFILQRFVVLKIYFAKICATLLKLFQFVSGVYRAFYNNFHGKKIHLSMFDDFRLYTFKKMGFPCKLCSKIYSDSSSYKRHVNSVHLNEKFKCAKCEYQTNRKDVLSKHFRRKHESNKRKPETQIESDNKRMKLQDCNDDWRFFENWLNTDHNDQEYEIDMEDVEKFVNNMHGKGTEIYQHG